MDERTFWTFAGQVWNVACVRESLLRWQDEKNIDVIFLLFACWYPRRLPPPHWAFLQAGSAHWQQRVTARIRTLRRRLKRHAWVEGHRACVNLELQAEHMAAAWLCHVSVGSSMHPGAAPNLVQRLRRLFPTVPRVELQTLLDTCALIPQQSGPNRRL